MNKYFVLITSLLFLFVSAQAQDVIQLDYKKARQMALDQNQEVQNARLDVKISQKKVWETTAIGLPQVSTAVSYNNYIDIPVTLIPAVMFDPNAAEGDMLAVQFGTEHNGSLNLTASQLIFSGEYIVGLQASRTYKYLSEQSLEKTESDVLEAVSQTYHTLLFAYENMQILEASKKDMAATLKEMEAIYKAGMTDETSVDQLKLNLHSLENAISSMQRQIDVQEQYLKIQMGLNVKDSIVVSDSLTQVFTASQVEQTMMQQFDLNKNIDYKLMNTQVALQELNLKREKSLYLPTLSGFYQHQESGQGNEFDFFDSEKEYYQANIIGLSLDWTLFTSGGRNAKVQQQQMELQKLQNTQSQLAQQLEMSMSQTRSELRNAYETYLREKENVQLAKKIYDNTLIGFKAGTQSSTDLTTINTQYLNSQASYYSAMMNVLNQKVSLDKTLGNK